jgi:hypothetical protein
MRERQKSLQRLLAVKSQLHRLEEAQLIETQRRKQALADDRLAMFDLLGNAERVDSLVLALACREILRADKGERDLAVTEEAQRLQLLHRSAQKKALEKNLTETKRALDRDAERRALLELGEGLAASSPSSLGQV